MKTDWIGEVALALVIGAFLMFGESAEKKCATACGSAGYTYSSGGCSPSKCECGK